MRSWLEGVVQPVILSVQPRAVGRHQQGAVVGLRQTGQRFSSILIPPVVGAVADRWGTGESFFIFGAFMLMRTAGADHPSHSGAPTRGRRAMCTT